MSILIDSSTRATTPRSLDYQLAVRSRQCWSSVLAISWVVLACGDRTPALRDAAPPRQALTAGGDSPYASYAVEPRELQAKLLTNDPELGRIASLALVGGTLVVSEGPSASIHFVDPRTGKLLRTFGRRGDGPGDFNEIAWLQRDPDDSTRFWFGESLRFRMHQYSVKARAGAEFVRMRTMIATDGSPLAGNMQSMPGGNVIGTWYGRPPDERFVVIDTTNHIIRRFGGPFAGDPTIPLPIRVSASRPSVAAEPARGLFVAAARYASRMEIYEADGALRATAKVPFDFEVDIRPDPNTGQYQRFNAAWGNNYVAYGSIATSPGHIFALFSGERFIPPPRTPFPRWLHVFTWDGELEAVFRFDRRVVHVAADPALERLFAIVEDPEPAILVYDFKGLLGTPF